MEMSQSYATELRSVEDSEIEINQSSNPSVDEDMTAITCSVEISQNLVRTMPHNQDQYDIALQAVSAAISISSHPHWFKWSRITPKLSLTN
jgi:hypothetical protein